MYSSRYGLISNGNFPNYEKVDERESTVSAMKLMVKILDTTEHAQRDINLWSPQKRMYANVLHMYVLIVEMENLNSGGHTCLTSCSVHILRNKGMSLFNTTLEVESFLPGFQMTRP